MAESMEGAARRSDAAIAGLVAVAPTLMMVAPFGVVSGAIFAETGLSLLETLAFSVIVFAGASQLATLELLRDGGSVLIVVLTGLAINLRFSLYAAALAPHWRGASTPVRAAMAYLNIDNMVPLAIARYRARRDEGLEERLAYYAAGAVISVVVWQGATGVGYALGALAPAWLGLDYAAAIAFVALAMPLLVDRPSWAAGIAAAATAIVARDAPFNLGIMIAATAGIAAGLLAELLSDARAARDDQPS